MPLEIDARELRTPFKVAFRHAAAERDAAQSVWVVASDGRCTGVGEGCPRRYVTGESVESALDFIASVSTEVARLADIGMLQDWVSRNRARIDLAPAAWCAVELALLDYFARCEKVPVETLLGLPPLEARYCYTAVLGDSADSVFDAQLAQYRALGFRDFKSKASGDPGRDAARIRAVNELGGRLRLDANNLWRNLDELAEWLAGVELNVTAVEEPLDTRELDELRSAADLLGRPVILDENFLRLEQLRALSKDAERWIVNIRVSKMGGVLHSLEIARAVREAGIRAVVGAQVGETSVLTRAALPVATAVGDLLVGQEGAFGEYLLERDPVEPVLQFGPPGLLEPGAIGFSPGWGLTIRD